MMNAACLRATALFCLCLLSALAGCAQNTEPAPPKPNPLGLSGKVSAEAETAYSQARVLWRASPAASSSGAEVCSDPALAIALLDKAISLEPEYAQAYLRRGLAKSDLGDFTSAFDDATMAVRLRPLPEHYAYRALISMKAGHRAGARRDLDYALEKDSSRHLAWTFLGALDLLEGRLKEACADFERACSAGDCSRLEASRREGLCP
jgi:tetratricopeptide (TPR) repeat protein